MATMRSLLYFIKEALSNSKKNFGTTFGAMITIFLSLLVIGVFMMGSILVDRMMKGVESEVSIQIFLHDNATEQDVHELQSYINSLPDVASVVYVSKEEALEKFKEMSDPEIVEQLEDNPLPASFSIELTDPENVQEVVDQITAQAVFVRVVETPDNPTNSLYYGQQIIGNLFAFANAIRIVCLVFVVMLIFVALVFINNTIRLAILARRKEIAIMRLVGASNGFIRGPFIMEGILQALIGAGLAILVINILSTNLIPQMNDMMPFLFVDYASIDYWPVYLLLLGIGIVIGLFGSTLAMRRYLKV